MKISPELWRQIDPLLTDALEMEDGARQAWLDALEQTHPQFTPLLRKMLAAHERAERSQELDTVSKQAPAPPPSSAFAAGARIGPFSLVRLLGHGGMGEVWFAVSETGAVKLPVALKLPHLSTSIAPGYLKERFERERVILGALNHPNIARLYEAGVTADGQPFLALEYVDGETILAHCSTRRLPIKARLALFVQVLKALQYAHANLIIHRDLKPSNILVTQTGEVKLLDFGIAKLLDAESQFAYGTELTELGGRAMTPDYASPEQIRGEALATTSDIYSAGVLLYELLAGRRPYTLKRGSRAELEEAILSSDILRPSALIGDDFATETGNTAKRLRRALTGDLDTIVIKALRKQPQGRYASAQALLDDLERYLAGQPVLAQADSLDYRVRKFLARHRLAAMAAASVFAAMVAGLGIALWQAGAAREQARLAQQEAARAEAVKKFLVSLMDRNSRFEKDPAAARAMSVQDLLLKEAIPKVRASFADQPAIKVELLATVAKLLTDLERDSESLELWREADTLAMKMPGINADLRLDILEGRFARSSGMGFLAEASDARERMIVLADQVEDPSGFFRMRAYARGNHLAAPPDRAREASRMQEALRIAETRFPDHPEHFALHYRLAFFYGQVPDWPKTIHHFRRAIALHHSTGNPDTVRYADAQVWLAFALGQVGEIRESLTLYEAAIASWEKIGGNASRLRVTRAAYAMALAEAGRVDDADREFRKVVGGYAANHQPETDDYAVTAYEAETALNTGRPLAALGAIARFPLPVAKVEVAQARSILLVKSLAHELLNDTDAANRAFAMVTGLGEGKADEENRSDVTYKRIAARIALLRGDYNLALRVLAFKDEVLSEKVPVPAAYDENFTVLNAMAARAYATKGDATAAKRSIDRALTNFFNNQKFADYPAMAADLAAVNGYVMLVNGDYQGGVSQLRKAAEGQGKIQAPASPHLMETRLNLAAAEAQLGNKAEAKRWCERVRADIKSYERLHPWFEKRLKSVVGLL